MGGGKSLYYYPIYVPKNVYLKMNHGDQSFELIYKKHLLYA